MNIRSILTPDRTAGSLQASSKKRAIEIIAEHIADSIPGLETGVIYRRLIEREKLRSTAIGSGVALPHSRLPDCDSIVGGLFVFDEPIDFSAYDDMPVQIIFTLLVPETETDEHLAALAMLAERFEQSAFRQKLLDAASNEDLYELAISMDDADSQAVAR